MKKVLGIILIILIAVSCEDRTDLTEPSEVDTGTADFTNFVSLGNSLTAGYQSRALYESAQNYSFGKQIADQVGATYVQPTISDPGIGGRIEVQSINPFSITSAAEDAGSPTNLSYAGIYNNLGIPGSLLPDILTAKDASTALDPTNIFFDIVLRKQGKTPLEMAIEAKPTLLTLWIGNNDILGYATSGGTVGYTPTETFAYLYDQLCGALAQAGIPVVLANIPNVSDIPFFTTVGSQLILSGITAVYGTKSDGSVVQMDLTKNLLTLDAQAELIQGKGLSASAPLSNRVILDEGEINTVDSVTSIFNATISSVSQKYKFHLVDINNFFNQVALNGYITNGVKFTTEYVSGGLFSLDGVHPTSQGYAIVANLFIQKINDDFNANIPKINVSEVPGSLELSKQVSLGRYNLPKFKKGTFERIFY